MVIGVGVGVGVGCGDFCATRRRHDLVAAVMKRVDEVGGASSSCRLGDRRAGSFRLGRKFSVLLVGALLSSLLLLLLARRRERAAWLLRAVLVTHDGGGDRGVREFRKFTEMLLYFIMLR